MCDCNWKECGIIYIGIAWLLGRIELLGFTVKTQGLLQPFMVISVAIYMLWSFSVLHFSCNYLEKIIASISQVTAWKIRWLLNMQGRVFWHFWLLKWNKYCATEMPKWIKITHQFLQCCYWEDAICALHGNYWLLLCGCYWMFVLFHGCYCMDV